MSRVCCREGKRSKGEEGDRKQKSLVWIRELSSLYLLLALSQGLHCQISPRLISHLPMVVCVGRGP